MNVDGWIKYQTESDKGVPRPLLVEALNYVDAKDRALDIGAGALNGSQFLLDMGFSEVDAIDLTPQFKSLKIKKGAHFKYFQRSFGQYHFPLEAFDLISAEYALPFCDRESFDSIWNGMERSLRWSGIFAGQLFGVEDGWAGNPNMTFHSRKDIAILTKQFSTIKIKEIQFVESSSRRKLWHYFDLILKKRRSPSASAQ